MTYDLPDQSTSGKFWIGEARPEGLMLHWGKQGTSGQQRFIPADKCESNNAVLELEARAAKKLKDGYVLIPTKSSL